MSSFKRSYLMWLLLVLLMVGTLMWLIMNRTSTSTTSTRSTETNITISDELDWNPDPIEEPILYDFVHSTIGYMSNVQPDRFGNTFAILVRNETLDSSYEKGSFHIMRVFPQDFLPPISTGSIQIKLSGTDWLNSRSAFQNWPEERRFKDKRWTLFLLSEGKSNDRFSYTQINGRLMWNGIDLSSFEYPEGWLQKNLRNGWSTNWLRKEPYSTRIWDWYKIDMNDEFFDKFKLHEVILVPSLTDPKDFREVRVVGVDRFNMIDPPVWQGMSLEQVNAQLKEEGYELIDR